ncbi:unnamed protein product [Rotaria socialis]|uniref:Uncharacterized protein n=1 Tax=Rotaria socialis TaxID=392032 RepID=A0A817V4B6_9BILA|nr:unnamed protein product [Rotaria socialis]CAF3338887.1 unnamed protein product [Rotaria socialis]CAF4282357.1 unnamed protein product [Rotaria socialis]CAF4418056.1 unnamed protein product [Rotaria socialis]
MSEAKQLLDTLIAKANTDTLRALVEIRNQAEQDIVKLTEQSVVLNSQELKQLLESTATTIITCQSLTAENPVVMTTVPITETAITSRADESVTDIANNEMQITIRSPTELVLSSMFPIRNAVDTTVLDMTAEASEVITTIDNSTNVEKEIESMPENRKKKNSKILYTSNLRLILLCFGFFIHK